jgi:hypothetical protein
MRQNKVMLPLLRWLIATWKRSNLQPVGSRMALHLCGWTAVQIVLFQQVAEAAHRGIVGRWLAAKMNRDKTGDSPANREAASSAAEFDRMNHCFST